MTGLHDKLVLEAKLAVAEARARAAEADADRLRDLLRNVLPYFRYTGDGDAVRAYLSDAEAVKARGETV